jgi:processive 1,2-diacylglycerol beta-glucosyltransferase
MKGAFLYVDAGKGHYIPAVALADAFKDMGHEAVVEDLYIAFKRPFFRWVSKYYWRFLLHHTNFEKKIEKVLDHKSAHTSLINLSKNKRALRHFKAWFLKEKPDFLLSTNFMGGTLLPAIIKKIGIDCPVYDYAADLFDQVYAGIDNEMTMCYVSTALGVEHIVEMGQDPAKTKLCPFPLSKKFEVSQKLSKQEARAKLGLKDKFTVLWNLGGEGIGNPKLLYGLVERGLDVQVVVVGGKSKSTELEFNKFKEKHPDFDLHMMGFVKNIQDYIMACDLQMGKAGANSLMESLYLKRPFLVSEVLYMARSTQLFFDKHPVGWTSDDLEEKLDIIEKAYKDPEVLKKIDAELQNLPVDFSAPHFAEMLIQDTLEYRKTHSKNY